MRGFKLPIFMSVLLHVALMGALIFSVNWQVDVHPVPIHSQQIVKATVVDSSLIEAVEQRKVAEQAQKQRELEAQRQKQAEKKRQEQLALKAEQEKKLAIKEKLKIEQETQERVAAEKKRQQEKQRLEAERKKQEELARKRQEDARRKQVAEQLDAEEAALLDQMHADISASEMDKYVGYIRDKVSRVWIRPADLPASLTCSVRVRIIPGGDVASVSIVRSSGLDAFDRSVEAAVYKASPLPVPSDIRQFEKLREIEFEFNPGK
jgi:colicin import membrane protein